MKFSLGQGFIAGALALLTVGCVRAPIHRVEWPVMGTVAAIQWRGEAEDREAMAARETVRQVFAEVERLLNAHDPKSELSKLAKFADAEVLARCEKTMRPCYQLAFAWERQTDGAFSPRWRGRDTLDLGAIAKGFAVDLAYERLQSMQKLPDLLIDLGGNLRSVKGVWRVGIEGDAREFELAAGEACATSAEYYRGRHIYDARTGKPVESGVKTVTVVARTAMWADLLSSTAFIFGRADAVKFFARKEFLAVYWVDAE